jgi:hypothetical protein
MSLRKTVNVLLQLFMVGALCACTGSTSFLPDKIQLQKDLKTPPTWIKVKDPYLSSSEKLEEAEYLGYPAEKILDHYLGKKWREADNDIQFSSKDGSDVVVPVERFKMHKAYIVFEQRGLYSVSEKTLQLNEGISEMGPYFLIWDDISSPDEIKTDLPYWSFQVSQVSLTISTRQALLPKGMSGDFAEQADLSKKYCLGCHQVNGVGSKNQLVSSMNLVKRVRGLDETDFLAWVLTPKIMMPSTTKTPFLEDQPLEERVRVATQIYSYLKALPVHEDPHLDWYQSESLLEAFFLLEQSDQFILLIIHSILVFSLSIFLLDYLRARSERVHEWAPHPPTAVGLSAVFALFLAFHASAIWAQKMTAERAFSSVSGSAQKFADFIGPNHVDSPEARTAFRKYLLAIVYDEWYATDNLVPSSRAQDLLKELNAITIDLGNSGKINGTVQSHLFRMVDDLASVRSTRLWIGAHHLDTDAWSVVLWLGLISHLGFAAAHLDKPRGGKLLLALFSIGTTSSYWLLIVANNPYNNKKILDPEILLRIMV